MSISNVFVFIIRFMEYFFWKNALEIILQVVILVRFGLLDRPHHSPCVGPHVYFKNACLCFHCAFARHKEIIKAKMDLHACDLKEF